MAAVLIFGSILGLMGVSFGVPVAAHRQKAVSHENTPVLGAIVLVLSLGLLNMGALIWSAVSGQVTVPVLVFGLAPLAAGALGARVIRSKIAGPQRTTYIVTAALLTVLGLPGYFGFPVSLLVAVIGACSFAAGLVRNPAAILRSLDPRV